MHAIAVLLVLLAFFTQAVFCFIKNVNFSTPEQCGPFQVNFSGSTTVPVLPLSLTIVPIFSNPISVILPVDTWDNNSDASSAHITFLPLSSGTKFVASLDDGTGTSVGFVSDVIAVKDSNVTTCLPPKQKGTNFYRMHGDLSQCSRFNVTFDPSTIHRIPSVRAFLPRYLSFFVNATDTPVSAFTPGRNFRGKNDRRDGGGNSNDNDNDGGNNGTHGNNSFHGNSSFGNNVGNNNHFQESHNISSKEYILDIMHGFQAVLAFDDGEGHRESSMLFTAGGTSSSSSTCFKEAFSSPSRSAESSSSSRSRGEDRLSRTAKIVVSVLGASVAISISIIIFILIRKRQRIKRDMEKTSFVFTEDVDMGSSFLSLASRIRARISQMTYGKRSCRSYQSYRDEKDGASAWVPTSPIGSLDPLSSKHASWMHSEKTLSWIGLDKDAGGFAGDGVQTLVRNSRVPGDGNGLYTLPNVELASPMPLFPVEAHMRWPRLDVPMPAVSRSSESSRFLLGSGYLSSRSSGLHPIVYNDDSGGLIKDIPKPNVPLPAVSRSSGGSRFILGSGYLSSRSSGAPRAARSDIATGRNKHQPVPQRRSEFEGGRLSSGAVLSTDFSSGYMPSRSSSATPEPGNNGIYISSPIYPSSDLPHHVVSSRSNVDSTKPQTTLATRDAERPDSRYFTPTGNLHREGSQNRGRIQPFPTVSLRVSRASEQ